MNGSAEMPSGPLERVPCQWPYPVYKTHSSGTIIHKLTHLKYTVNLKEKVTFYQESALDRITEDS